MTDDHSTTGNGAAAAAATYFDAWLAG